MMQSDSMANHRIVQTGRVTTEGDDLYYEVRCPDSEKNYPALVLIPGGGGDADGYALVADILADEYKVITYDRRANARSTMTTPLNFEISQQSRDVVAVLRAAGEESAFVFGNSSGAVIALDMAVTQPQAVRAVVAHEPPVARLHPDAKKWQRFYASVYSTAFHFGSSVAMVRFLLGTGFPVWQMIQASLEGKIRRTESREPRISSRANNDFFVKQELLPVINYLPDVERIKQNGVKVIMAAGNESLDKKRWYAQTAPILAGLLGCEMVNFPGHHTSFLTSPEEWTDVLRVVLKGVEPAS